MTKQEWRTLPEFPNYEITSDGDVRNRWSYKVLKEIENKRNGSWHYSLRRTDGSSTSRGFWSLIYSAYPELKVEVTKATAPEEPKRRYAKRGGWVDIPGFSPYQIHPDRVVRNGSRRRVEIQKDVDEEYVLLLTPKGKTTRTIDQLMAESFKKAG